jgi:DNA polymerase-3 subunit gamma/tau
MIIMAKKYEELYKKYRPRTWDEIVGQDKIVSNLRSSVANDRLATAYLFAGPYGCGKTTTALIFAKAINCERPDGKGNPCNECATCKSIDAGANIAVHYVSAANFEGGGVNDIKSIVDQAKRRSAIAKPIWIIDEIQRLSPNAKDALLIPLEDPSMPSIFIFCTTEIDRIPETITSRVQQRAFKLVSRKRLKELCVSVLAREGYKPSTVDNAEEQDAGGKTFTDDLVNKVIKDAGVTFEGGSARQVLSELDHILSTPEAYKADWTRMIEADLFLDSVKNPLGNATKALLDLSNAVSDGVNVKTLTRSIVDFMREMVLILSLPDDMVKTYPAKRVDMARRLGPVTLLKCFKIMAKAQRDSTLDNDTRTYCEVALIEISSILRKRKKELETG